MRTSDNELRIVSGSYEIADATGVFEGMGGSGRITGSLTCLAGALRETGAESCADLGMYTDAVLQLRGRYEI